MVQLLWGGDRTPVGEVEVGEGWLQRTLPQVTDVNPEVVTCVLCYGKLVITKRQIRLSRGFCYLRVSV